jgi:hypothetical protein
MQGCTLTETETRQTRERLIWIALDFVGRGGREAYSLRGVSAAARG